MDWGFRILKGEGRCKAGAPTRWDSLTYGNTTKHMQKGSFVAMTPTTRQPGLINMSLLTPKKIHFIEAGLASRWLQNPLKTYAKSNICGHEAIDSPARPHKNGPSTAKEAWAHKDLTFLAATWRASCKPAKTYAKTNIWHHEAFDSPARPHTNDVSLVSEGLYL